MSSLTLVGLVLLSLNASAKSTPPAPASKEADTPKPGADVVAAKMAADELRDRVWEGHVYRGLPVYPKQRCSQTAQTTVELNQCLNGTLAVAQAEMNRVHETATSWLKLYREKEQPKLADQFAKQQTDWEQLAKNSCQTQSALYEGGTAMPSEYLRCMICQTRARTRVLELFLDTAVNERENQRQAERAAWREEQPPLCEE